MNNGKWAEHTICTQEIFERNFVHILPKFTIFLVTLHVVF